MSGFRPTGYQRDVFRYLRDAYGVDGLKWKHGTNHPGLRFEYRGRPYTITLQNVRTSERSTFKLKQRDLRNLLGPPPTPHKETITVLDTNITEPEQSIVETESALKPTVAATGTAGAYRFNDLYRRCQLRLFLPNTVIAAFNHTGGVDIERLGDEDWAISISRNKTPVIKKNRLIGGLWDLTPFGVSPAEYVFVDGKIMVHVPIASRVGVRRHNDGVTTTEVKVEVKPVKARDAYDRLDVAWIRNVLESIRRIETETEHRLERSADGRWAFVARIE